MNDTLETVETLCNVIEQLLGVIKRQQSAIGQAEIASELFGGDAVKAAEQALERLNGG